VLNGADMLRVRPNVQLKVNPQDLGIEVEQGQLLVPAELGRVLDAMGITTAEGFVSAVRAFPTQFTVSLQMDARSFEAAVRGAIDKLRGSVADSVLEGTGNRRARGMGALPPRVAGDKR